MKGPVPVAPFEQQEPAEVTLFLSNNIQRLQTNARMSQVLIANSAVHLARRCPILRMRRSQNRPLKFLHELTGCLRPPRSINRTYSPPNMA